MITFLQGRLVEKTPTRLVIDVHGVGYEVNISLSTYRKLGEKDEVRILTYLHVRDDEMRLFGFADSEERELFLQLISVPGIGPRLAQNILSRVSTEELQRAILQEDYVTLTSVSRVGRKTAQRLVVDLKERLSAGVPTLPPHLPEVKREEVEEAILALMCLGYKRPEAQRAVERAFKEEGPELSVEDLVKAALKFV